MTGRLTIRVKTAGILNRLDLQLGILLTVTSYLEGF